MVNVLVIVNESVIHMPALGLQIIEMTTPFLFLHLCGVLVFQASPVSPC